MMRGVRKRPRAPFWLDRRLNDGGFSSAGVAIALLISLSLVFASAQVYRVQSAAADVQDVADTAALAADNIVAEYYLVARVCDAIVLSLTLTGIIGMGVGVAALCTPLSAKAGTTLINIGKKLLRARDKFARRAAEGLDKLQKALPFLATAAAYRVAAANGSSGGGRYLGFTVVLPFEGKQVSPGKTGASDSLIDAVDGASDTLKQAGKQAEEAAKAAKEAKERAYRADCGDNPGHCMLERAAALAGLQGDANPYFSSVDTWGFSVALERARAYYARRLAIEQPQGDSVDERANSVLRKRFYEYAVEAMAGGYVNESEKSFEAHFPLLPRNADEMRTTHLFTDPVYPVSMDETGACMLHAWEGCPLAANAVGLESLASQEAGSFVRCPECLFDATSLGNVAAASTSIDNGFEYHYRIVAAQAKEYQQAREACDPKAERVRTIAGALFGDAMTALREMASQRIEVAPPGRFGVVAIVAGIGSSPLGAGLAARLSGGGADLGPRVAISGATLVSDSPEQGRTVISSILDGVRERSDVPFAGMLDGMMDVWSAALFAYSDGQARIGEGLDELDSRLPLDSESGLGLWGAKEFSQFMESLGLQPAKLDAPKPALVNTGHVLQADEGTFSARLLGVKRVAVTLTGDNLFEGAIGLAEGNALDGISGLGDEITIAEIEIAGAGTPKIPIVITLPEGVRDDASGMVSSAANWLRELVGSITGVRQWR